jgi:hypothetical protein
MKKIILGLVACLPFISGAETMDGTNRAIYAPEYLSVPHFKECLSTQNAGTYERWCLPKNKPSNCFIDSWEKLNRMKLVSKCIYSKPLPAIVTMPGIVTHINGAIV